MVKADEKVVYDEEHPEDFTEFEYLKAKVEQLESVIDSHADILRDNNLTLTSESNARYVSEDEVFEALAGK